MKAFIRKKLPIIILLLSALILLIRAFYGFCWSDETFYYAVAGRFVRGDVPLYEEWHPTQLNGVFLMPFVALFRLITGGCTGLILTFRILYVCVSTAIAYMAFRVLKKETGTFSALLGALLFLFYTHLNIATFSYYALTVLSSVTSILCLLHYLQNREQAHAARFLVYAGITCSVTVLSMPLLAVCYFVLAFALFLSVILANTRLLPASCSARIREAALLRMFFLHLLGILIVAVPFLLYLLSKLSVGDLIASVPYVLSDEEHAGTTLYVIFRRCFLNLSDQYGFLMKAWYVLMAVCLLRLLASCVHAFSKKHASVLRLSGSVLSALNLLLFAGFFLKSIGHTGYIQVALVLFSLPLFLLDEHRNYRLFFLFYPAGAAVAYCYTYGSTGSALYEEAVGFAVVNAAACAVITGYANSRLKEKENKAALILNAAVHTALVLCLVLTMFLRINNVYRDDKLPNLNAKITEGPGAGIYTTAEHLSDYNDVLQTIGQSCMLASYPDGTHKTFFVSRLAPFAYLCSDLTCAAPTPWRLSMSSERLMDYYALHPDRVPDVVLVLHEELGRYETCGDVEADPLPNANDPDGPLYRYMDEHAYTKKSVPCGTLFVKP
ncbi:MAG: hypothetical protein J5518_05230 [Lachnospiraceae bacterium]|nr:hypothetical protein [Lachnospiraceae bacterium]